MMDRRAFLAGTGSVLLAAPLAAEGQGARKVPRIGVLLTTGSPETVRGLEAFRQGLRERGYVEGQTILIEYRSADGTLGRLPHLATELANVNVDVILAVATPAARAAQRVTTTIPIVALAMGDPVGDGLVTSLAQPGGNITGTTFLGPGLVSKRLELLKEALPKVTRIVALLHPGAFGERTMKDMVSDTEAAARTLNVQLQVVDVSGPDEFDRAFSTMARQHADALIVFDSVMLFSERSRIVALAAKRRLPAMFNNRESVEIGGLISYGVSLTDLWRRAATYVDKILQGTKPSDLPVEQPTKFELIINLKTSKALGLTIPPSLLGRADEVIQ